MMYLYLVLKREYVIIESITCKEDKIIDIACSLSQLKKLKKLLILRCHISNNHAMVC